MKIKNTFIAFFCLMLSVGFAGCDDFLHVTSDSQKLASESFKTYSDLRGVTGYLYANPWYQFNSNALYLIEGRSNNFLGAGTSSVFLTYAGFSETSGTSYLSNVWSSLYIAITQSDYIINTYVPQSREYVDATEVNACNGEARFMRGTAYWYLAMLWHDVPIIDDPTAIVTNPQVNVNRFEDVLQYAINDLTYASDSLYSTDDAGRVTKYSAKGMLARVCLTAADYAMGDHFSTDYLTRNGVSSNAELAQLYFTKVKTLTEDVITNGTQYGLMDDYEDLFKVQKNNNKESLFSLQFVPGSSTWGLGNGLQDGLATNNTLTGGLNAWGNWTWASYDFVHLSVLDKGKSRMRGNIFVDGQKYTYLGTSTTAGYWTAPNEQCNIKKQVVGSTKDSGGSAINGNSGLMSPMLRMADVYLMYTEACMGTATSTTDALALTRFNAVHKRAFYVNPTDYTAFTTVTRNDLFKERRLEFFMENLFWQDVVRRSFYDTDWVLKYLNNKLVDEDATTELTNNIWYSYSYNPASTTYTNGWSGPTASTKAVPLEAKHDMGSATYVHSSAASDNVWALPYPSGDLTKDPLLTEEPVKYNF